MATAELLTAIKVAYKGEVHRLRVDLNHFAFPELMGLFQETFGLREGSFVVQYKDPEGDCVNVCSDVEFREACHVSLNDDQRPTLRFVAVPKVQVAFQENVAEPILKAIEKLVETLNVAMAKVKREQWAQRAQSGLDQTNVALQRAASDARDTFSAARQSFQDIPFDQIMKETAEGLKSTAEGISVFARDVVDDLRNYKNVSTETPSNNNEEHIVDEKNEEPAVKEDVPVASDSEWEQVSEQTPPQTEEAPVLVNAFSPEEQMWADQLATIRDILPNVDTARAIERLEQANGNVEVVLNSMMEDM